MSREKRGGRPCKDLGRKDLERVEHLASLGVSQKDIVPVLAAGVADRTLRDKIATMPEVSAAYARGRGKQLELAVRRAWNMAMGEGPCSDMPRSEQAKMLRWLLERQFGMTAQQDVRLSTPGDGPIKIVEIRYHLEEDDESRRYPLRPATSSDVSGLTKLTRRE